MISFNPSKNNFIWLVLIKLILFFTDVFFRKNALWQILWTVSNITVILLPLIKFGDISFAQTDLSTIEQGWPTCLEIPFLSVWLVTNLNAQNAETYLLWLGAHSLNLSPSRKGKKLIFIGNPCLNYLKPEVFFWSTKIKKRLSKTTNPFIWVALLSVG